MPALLRRGWFLASLVLAVVNVAGFGGDLTAKLVELAVMAVAGGVVVWSVTKRPSSQPQ